MNRPIYKLTTEAWGCNPVGCSRTVPGCTDKLDQRAVDTCIAATLVFGDGSITNDDRNWSVYECVWKLWQRKEQVL